MMKTPRTPGKWLAALAITLALACMFALAGCTTLQDAFGTLDQSQKSQLAAAYDTYEVTLNILSDMRENGQLTDEDVAHIDRWQNVAWSCLEAWEKALENDRQPGVAIDSYHAVMQKLSNKIVEGPQNE